jgi:predicted AlkP superfamily phosphohydrolase/phosphomutase
MEDLLQFADPATGEAVISHIWTREDAFAGSQMRDAPDLTVRLRDNGFISILDSDVLLESRIEPLGTHYPEGIFIAGGPGIRKGISPLRLSILDVTPALLYSLGLPIPDDLEGRVREEIFEPSLLQARPVRVGEPTQPPEPFPGRPAKEEAADQAKTFAMLKALGYVE